MPDSDSTLYEQIALRRVHDGGVTKLAGVYLDRGQATPEYLTAAFDRLTWTDLATIGSGDPIRHPRPLMLTPAGLARYDDLRSAERPGQQVPDPVFGTSPQTPAGRRSSDPHAAPGGRPGPAS